MIDKGLVYSAASDAHDPIKRHPWSAMFVLSVGILRQGAALKVEAWRRQRLKKSKLIN